jgi:hypothetical protein
MIPSTCALLHISQAEWVHRNAKQVHGAYFPLGYKGFTASIEVTY